MKQPYNTALYMRLSRDDETYGDSVSIETQRTILQTFAKETVLPAFPNISMMAGAEPTSRDRASSG